MVASPSALAASSRCRPSTSTKPGPVRAHQDRRLLALREHAMRDCLERMRPDNVIALLLLTGFPSRRILNRHATRNAAALAVNDGRNRTDQPGLIFGIEFRQLRFADVSNVLFHVFGSVLLLKLSVFHPDGLTDQPAVFLLRQPIKTLRARFLID